MAGPIDDGLSVRAIGPATAAGRIPLAELARIASTLQATLERIALSVAGGRRRSGRRPFEIANAVRMDFVGFSAGSAVLELDRGESGPAQDHLALGDDLLDESFVVLIDGLNEIRRTGARPAGQVGHHFNSTVLNGLAELCGGIGRQSLTRIEFHTNNHIHFTLDPEIKASIRRIRRATVAQDTTIVGRLHMGDFDPMVLRCRIDTNLGSVLCDFDVELKDEVFDLLDQLVAASGTAELHPDGVSVRVLHIAEISAMATAKARSLDELAQEQRVSPLADAHQLRGAPVEDFDLFLEAIRAARGADE